MASTLRLPPDLDHRLAEHCREHGATKNRVCVIALRHYLDDAPPPRVALTLREPDDSPFAGERLGALRLVREMAARGLDVARISEATGLDPDRVAAACDQEP